MNLSRKVRQLVVIQDSDVQQGSFIAVCEDGTMWDRVHRYVGEEYGNKGDPNLYKLVWELIPGPPVR